MSYLKQATMVNPGDCIKPKGFKKYGVVDKVEKRIISVVFYMSDEYAEPKIIVASTAAVSVKSPRTKGKRLENAPTAHVWRYRDNTGHTATFETAELAFDHFIVRSGPRAEPRVNFACVYHTEETDRYFEVEAIVANTRPTTCIVTPLGPDGEPERYRLYHLGSAVLSSSPTFGNNLRKIYNEKR